MRRIKVLVVDDHPIVREGLRKAIEAQPDMQVVGEAGDGREALEAARRVAPEVILLDIAMPRLSGFEAAQSLRQAAPAARVVILSMYEKEEYVFRLLEAGAQGYVLKGSSGEEILTAIRAASRGEYFLSSRISAEVIGRYLQFRPEKKAPEGYDLLSEREQGVFRLLVEGHGTAAIAGMLFISPKTVEKHRINIMRKLEISDLIGMVKYAVRIGLIDPDSWKH